MSTGSLGLHHALPGRSLLRDGLAIGSLVFLGWVWLFAFSHGSHVDAEAYWRAAGSDPYAVSHAGDAHAYLYTPVVAQLLAPLGAAPLAVTTGMVLTLSLVAAVYLIGPVWTAALLVVPLPFLWQDLMSGNIHVLLAAATVVGLRFPAAWTFVLLTKVTPGIGLIWFVVRREWRSLLVAVILTGAMVGVSLAAAPGLWAEWMGVLASNATTPPSGLFVPIPLAVRLVGAAGIVTWGAATDRPWTVPLAAFLALPIIWLWDGFAMLLGVLAVLRRQRQARHADV